MKKKGFTLIELLVVIAIIGLLATVSVVAFSNAQKKARDARRLADMAQIQKALELYKDENGVYPPRVADSCCDGWDQGPCNGDNTFITGLQIAGIMGNTPVDPSGGTGTGCYGYVYYVYPIASATAYACDQIKPFYVLAVNDMETSGRPHPDSPGFSCTGRDWGPSFDWVAGNFE